MDLTGRVERIEHQLERVEQRLLAIDNSPFFELLRWPRQAATAWRSRLGRMLLHSRLHPLYLKIVRPRRHDEDYRAWVRREAAAQPAPAWYRQRIEGMRQTPCVSIVMPVHNPPRAWLEEAVQSVERQYYPCWELCVCDDASTEAWVREYFAGKAAQEPRVRFLRSGRHLNIAAAATAAARLAGGAYVGFLDQDDVLPPHALYHVAEALQDGPADLIYSDEDRLDEAGQRVQPIFKPAWSPDLLLSCMYVGHFLVVRRTRLEEAGWLRTGFDGGQDYDLALRLTDGPAVVRHIPRVLYHWRRHAGSTSADIAAKPYAHEVGFKALSEALVRRRLPAIAQEGPFPITYRVRWQVEGQPRASLVICSRNVRLMRKCLRGIAGQTDYPHREVVVVQHMTGDDGPLANLLKREGCTRVCYSGPFDFAAMSNLGAQHAGGEILVFLNDDVVPLNPDWLRALVAQLQRPEIGVVGGRLVYPHGALQHAGLVIGIMNGAGHVHRHTLGSPYWNWWPLTRNVAAVTGACLGIRRELFEQAGGFDSRFPVNYNDADFCLRVRRAGYEVLYEPAALLCHAECQTRRPGIRYAETSLWRRRWSGWLERGDPYYSTSLSDTTEDASLRVGECGDLPAWR